MPGMQTYIELFERLRSVHLHVDAQRCLVVRNRNTRCARCADACPSECISIIGRAGGGSVPDENGEGNAHFAANGSKAASQPAGIGQLVVDPSRCIGCGTCSAACPTEAISARKPDDRTLARQAAAAFRATGGTVAFACEQLTAAARGRYNPETVVSVRCVGRVDTCLLVLFAAAGAKTIRLACGNCAQCAYAAGRGAALQACEDANAIFAAWGICTRASVAPKLPAACRATSAASYDPERRAFLQTAGESVHDAALDAANLAIERAFDHATDAQRTRRAVMEAGALPRHLPTRRAVLLDALARLGQPADVMLATRLWGHVVLDEERCSGCGMCASFCPTGALTVRCSVPTGKANTWLSSRNAAKTGFDGTVLVHAPGLCLQCRTCEQLCPQHAIELSCSVFAVDIGAGTVDEHPLRAIRCDKGGPDAIRNSMAKLINSPYVTG